MSVGGIRRSNDLPAMPPVGAGRELPAHPRISALTSTASFIGGRGLNVLLPTPTAGAQSRPGAACSNRNAQRFNRDAARHVATKTIHAAFMVVLVSVGHTRGWGCGVSRADHHSPPAQTSTGTANGRITTRRAASLRPSGNGRIRFKPPYSKRGNPSRAPHGFNLYRRPSPSCG